jgi:hypothetical protein
LNSNLSAINTIFNGINSGGGVYVMSGNGRGSAPFVWRWSPVGPDVPVRIGAQRPCNRRLPLVNGSGEL